MKVILLEELRGKGGEGDIVEVAQGFAENYLYPNRIAMPATPGNLKQLEERRHNIQKREEKRIADATAIKETIEGKTVTVDARVGEEGQLFGSVTTAQIADAVKEQLGIEIDRKRIERSANIKTAGLHQVTIGLYRDINAALTVAVGSEEDMAAAAAAAGTIEAPVEEAEELEAEVAEDAAEVVEEATEEVAETAEEAVEE